MVEYLKDIKIREIEDFAGGEGGMCARDFLELKPPHMRLFSHMTMQPDSATGVHSHPGETEIVYVLKGVASMIDNGKKVILHPGDCHICYDGDEHAIANHGEEPMEFLAVFTIN